jgi:hypothetical protein
MNTMSLVYSLSLFVSVKWCIPTLDEVDESSHRDWQQAADRGVSDSEVDAPGVSDVAAVTSQLSVSVRVDASAVTVARSAHAFVVDNPLRRAVIRRTDSADSDVTTEASSQGGGSPSNTDDLTVTASSGTRALRPAHAGRSIVTSPPQHSSTSSTPTMTPRRQRVLAVQRQVQSTRLREPRK